MDFALITEFRGTASMQHHIEPNSSRELLKSRLSKSRQYEFFVKLHRVGIEDAGFQASMSTSLLHTSIELLISLTQTSVQ